MKVHELSFIRNERNNFCLGTLRLTTPDTVSEKTAYSAFCAAVTEWIVETDSGRRDWGSNGEYFNFGDFLNSSPHKDKEFMAIARKHGIVNIEAGSLSATDCVYSWDDTIPARGVIEDAICESGEEDE